MTAPTAARRIYNIRGTLWVQDELTYVQDGEVKDLLSTVDEAFTELDPAQVPMGDIIARLYDAGVVPQLFALILSPYERTPWRWVLNRILRAWHKLDPQNLPSTGRMKNSEMARVVSDFFFLNTAWMWPSPDTPNGSDWSQTMATVIAMMGRSPSTSPSTSSAAETLSSGT